MENQIKFCTFKTLLELAEPINLRVIDNTNKSLIEDGLQPLTDKMERSLKVSNTVSIAKMLKH